MNEFFTALEEHAWSAICFGAYLLALFPTVGVSVHAAVRGGDSKKDKKK